MVIRALFAFSQLGGSVCCIKGSILPLRSSSYALLSVEQALEALARAGCRVVDVVLPGFAADCLETLEEIQTEAADIFRKHAVRYSDPSVAIYIPVYADELTETCRRQCVYIDLLYM